MKINFYSIINIFTAYSPKILSYSIPDAFMYPVRVSSVLTIEDVVEVVACAASDTLLSHMLGVRSVSRPIPNIAWPAGYVGSKTIKIDNIELWV